MNYADADASAAAPSFVCLFISLQSFILANGIRKDGAGESEIVAVSRPSEKRFSIWRLASTQLEREPSELGSSVGFHFSINSCGGRVVVFYVSAPRFVISVP